MLLGLFVEMAMIDITHLHVWLAVYLFVWKENWKKGQIIDFYIASKNVTWFMHTLCSVHYTAKHRIVPHWICCLIRVCKQFLFDVYWFLFMTFELNRIIIGTSRSFMKRREKNWHTQTHAPIKIHANQMGSHVHVYTSNTNTHAYSRSYDRIELHGNNICQLIFVFLWFGVIIFNV